MTLIIRRASTPADQATCMELRIEVFVEEQAVPLEIERDEHDGVALHFLAVGAQGAVATARVVFRDDGRTAKIGRVAVRRTDRGQGIGAALMRALEVDPALAGVARLYLEAQVHATGFYQRLGYTEFGPDFMDAGIPHRAMQKLRR